MTQEEFIKKFCPDYEKKMESYNSNIVQSSNPVYSIAIEECMLNDAIQNFAGQLREEERGKAIESFKKSCPCHSRFPQDRKCDACGYVREFIDLLNKKE